MIFKYTVGGALVCNAPIDGITQELDEGTARHYGGKYFIGESMTKATAHQFAICFGAPFKDLSMQKKEE